MVAARIPAVVVPVHAEVTIDLPKIPWNDAASVASYLSSLVFAATALIAMIHPGFSLPTIVPAIVTPVASVIAGIIQIVNIITHRNAQIAVLHVIQARKES